MWVEERLPVASPGFSLCSARALGWDVQVFAKPTAEQEARQQAEMERALRKTLVVPTHPVRTAKDFLDSYGEWHRSSSRVSHAPSRWTIPYRSLSAPSLGRMTMSPTTKTRSGFPFSRDLWR